MKDHGVFVWKYKEDGTGQYWEYRHHYQGEKFPRVSRKDVATRMPAQPGDWLLQKIHKGANSTMGGEQRAELAKKCNKIKENEIVLHFRESDLGGGGVQVYDYWPQDMGFVHSSSFQEHYYEKGPTLTQEYIQAAMGGDEDSRWTNEQQVLVLSTDGKGGAKGLCFAYHCDTGELEEFELDGVPGSFDLQPLDNDEAHLFCPEDRNLMTIAKRVSKIRTKLALAIQKHNSNDTEAAYKLVAPVIFELVTGAEPAPQQGPNAGLGVPSLVDTIEKLNQLANGVDYDTVESGPNLTGSFGSGFGMIDISWQSVASLLAFFKDVVNGYHILEKSRQARNAEYGDNAIIRKGVDLSVHLLKLGSTSIQATEALNNLVNFANAIPGKEAAPGMGVLTGTITTIRSGRQAYKAARRMWTLRKLLNKNKGELNYHVQTLLAYGMRKAERKVGFKAAEAGTAALGTVGAIVLVVGATAGAANAWNPVGWGISGVVVLAGTGLLTYKIVRKVTSKQRAKKRGFSKSEYATILLTEYERRFKNGETTTPEIHVLHAVLQAFGVSPIEFLAYPGQVKSDAEKRITRHLK